MEKKQNRNVVHRTINTYVWLFKIAKDSFKRSESEKNWAYYDRLVSMMFCALSLEGFFNHLVDKFALEQKIGKEKLDRKGIQNLIFQELGFEVDKNIKPFCYLGSIFEFRDEIAHAKTVNLKIVNAKMDKLGETPVLPGVKWEKMVSKETAKKFLDNTEEMISILYQKANLPGDPFFLLWSSDFWIDHNEN